MALSAFFPPRKKKRPWLWSTAHIVFSGHEKTFVLKSREAAKKYGLALRLRIVKFFVSPIIYFKRYIHYKNTGGAGGRIPYYSRHCPGVGALIASISTLRHLAGSSDLQVCVCLHIKQFFYPSTSSTTNVRADCSILEDTSHVVTKLRHRQQRYFVAPYAVSTAVGNAMPCHHTINKYDRHNIHIL